MDEYLIAFSRLPDVLKGITLVLAGLVMGVLANRAVYAWAWHRRAIGPWLPRHEDAPGRCWSDRLPVWGWWGLRREARLHGRGYWIRPLLIELLMPVVFVALYFGRVSDPSPGLPHSDLVVVHQQFLSHVLLLSLMLVATLIDFDEKTIPDEITIFGTMCGLALAAVFPRSVLGTMTGPLQLASPQEWPARLDGWLGLTIGCLALWFWCGALLTPRRIWLRRGPGRALVLLCASVRRHPYWAWLLGMGVLGPPLLAWIWWQGGLPWRSLLSSLVGVLFGTALVWSVRIIARRALGKEALGFGDVTLMAMMGAFLGWQPLLMVFFIAPFIGAIIAIVQWIATRNHEIAYGPYLCAAGTWLVLRWDFFWDRWGMYFVLGWSIPLILLICLALMGALLLAWRWVRGRFRQV